MSAHACPTPSKKPFKSQDAAMKSRRRLRDTLRVYLCECGFWHLTKKTAP